VILEGFGAVLIVIGSVFSCLAALGILRFPDVYTRLHAASKAGPLGAGLVLLGAGVGSGDPLTFIRTAIGLLFLILVSPVSAHLLARSALKSGVRPTSNTSIDDLEDSREAPRHGDM
jgi:multicomponent Na+:H+ antiporter subunit G